MADEIVAGIYESREDADAARIRLIEEGVPEERIRIEQRDTAGSVPMSPQDRVALEEVKPERGFAGFLSRMFSGALLDDDVARYADALHAGHSVLVVHVDSDERRRTASAILERGGPRVYPLPNAPTGWNESHANDPASIGGVDDDPVRPNGLLTDVEGLPVDADEPRLRDAPAGGKR